MLLLAACAESGDESGSDEDSGGSSIGSNVQAVTSGTAVPPGELEAVGELPGCSGSLIADQLVLTAAHCFCNGGGCAARTTFTLPDVVPVDDPATAVDESATRATVSVNGSTRIHPDFGSRRWLSDDYALVDLDVPVSTLAEVEPIVVSPPEDTALAGDVVTLVGFGATGVNCTSGSLGKQRMPLEIVAANYEALYFEGPETSCPGDSGGPALDSMGRIVGVSSHGEAGVNATYRPTSTAYNWIMGLPRESWAECQWVDVELNGRRNSHAAGEPWAPEGWFLVGLDIDQGTNIGDHDAPVVGQAQVCRPSSTPTGWATCSWHQIGDGGRNSHRARPGWGANGTFLVALDLDSDTDLSAHDSPLIGQAQFCSPAGPVVGWGSTYWVDIEQAGENSHQPLTYCNDGAYLVQLDLDVAADVAPADSPVIGRAKCSRPAP